MNKKLYRILFEGQDYISLTTTKGRKIGDVLTIDYIGRKNDTTGTRIGYTCKGQFSEFWGKKIDFVETIRPLTQDERDAIKYGDLKGSK